MNTLKLPSAFNRRSFIFVYLRDRLIKISGPVFTLLAILILEFVKSSPYFVPNPQIVLETFLVYTVFTGGMKAGFLSAFMIWIYAAYFYSTPGHLFEFNLPNLHRVVVTILSTSATTLMTGLLSWRAELLVKEKSIRLQTEEVNKRISNILESITDAFISLDRKGNFVYINKQAEKLLGRKRRELIGKNVWKEFPEFLQTFHYQIYKRVKQSNRPLRLEEYSPISNKWFEIHIFPAREGVSIYFSDITARKLLEEEKDQFIDIVSHELKSPVTTLKGYTQILRMKLKRSADAPLLRYISKMDDSLLQLNNLVSDLLDATRFTAGSLHFNKTRFKIDTLIKDVIKSCQRENKEYHIKFKGSTTHQLFADKQRINQVLTNLITNSIKYSPQKKDIRVLLSQSKSTVKVSVIDHGIGIPREYQKKIFNRYYRVPSHKNLSGGVGLGLYICSEIIKAHKGEIGVNSKLHKGSTFFFTLPLNSSPR